MSDPAGPEPGRHEAPPCVIGPGASFNGLLSFQGTALVAGWLRGEVCARGTLWIGETAEVRARIEVDELVVAGAVEGRIRARRVELLGTARVRARIRAPQLTVADGARFEGQLEMDAAAEEGPGPAQPASAP